MPARPSRAVVVVAAVLVVFAALRMLGYLDFLSGVVVARTFFAVATLVSLACVYAAIFARDLPRKFAVWFFSTLAGQSVTIPPSAPEDKTHWLNWVGFGLICAVPPVAWIVFELYFAGRAA